MLNSQVPSSSKILAGDQLLVRINGILPDIATLGSVEKSERGSRSKTAWNKYKYFLFFICHGKGN